MAHACQDPSWWSPGSEQTITGSGRFDEATVSVNIVMPSAGTATVPHDLEASPGCLGDQSAVVDQPLAAQLKLNSI